MFHVGHIRMLQEAKKYGSWVIVGVWNDDLVKKLGERPIMNMHERALGVLSCRVIKLI